MRALAGLASDFRWLSPSHRATIVVLAALVVALAGISSRMPLLRELENTLYDLRATQLAPVSATDKRVTLVVYTDDTNRATGEIAPVDRTILARALTEIDKLRPKAVGIDILFDSPQDDDPLLQAALRAMQAPTFLAYASSRIVPESMTFEQDQDLKKFVVAVASNQVRPASILLETDNDGVARRWPQQTPGQPPLLALAMSAATGEGDARFARYTGPIRFRRPGSSDRPVYDKVPIDLLADPATAELVRDVIKDRYILIGGDFSGFDQFDVPITRTGNTGLEIHAVMLAQLLDREMIPVLPIAAQYPIAALNLLIAVAWATVTVRRRYALLAGLAHLAGLVAFAIVLSYWLGGPAGLNLAGCLFAIVAGFFLVRSVRRAAAWEKGRTATLALHRYLPPDIAKSIVTHPDRLGLGGELRQVFVMFTDLEGFTKMCQKVEPQVVAEFLNDYLERICQVILDHGGTIDKFVGDAVVAFWGAPLATPDDGCHAVEAAVAIERDTATLIGNELGPNAIVGRTRIGIHYGTAIVGNFGGNGRLQYTALGDTMNVGARLEGANKELDTSILASGELVAQVPELAFRRMGRVTVRGRNAPLDIYEPALSADPAEVAKLNGFYDAVLRGDASALEAMSAWAQDHPDDVAMASLVRRLRSDEAIAPTSL